MSTLLKYMSEALLEAVSTLSTVKMICIRRVPMHLVSI